MHLRQDSQLLFPGRGAKIGSLRIIQHGQDDEDGIGAQGLGLDDLIRVKHEILA